MVSALKLFQACYLYAFLLYALKVEYVLLLNFTVFIGTELSNINNFLLIHGSGVKAG